VRDAALVLRINENEAQVMARIVDGFSQAKPNSFEQLE
jgi:hypothetical protein